MSNERGSTACANPECACTDGDGQTYCSSHCEHATEQSGKVENEMRSGCACGHPECDQPAD